MFISMMFAGHHTSSGTAAWTMIELLRHPDVLADVVAELDALYADGSEVSFQALRSIPLLEAALKETLRLHPSTPAATWTGGRRTSPTAGRGSRSAPAATAAWATRSR
jgi:cytochrome P450